MAAFRRQRRRWRVGERGGRTGVGRGPQDARSGGLLRGRGAGERDARGPGAGARDTEGHARRRVRRARRDRGRPVRQRAPLLPHPRVRGRERGAVAGGADEGVRRHGGGVHGRGAGLVAVAAADHLRGLLLPGGRHRVPHALRGEPRRLARRARPPRVGPWGWQARRGGRASLTRPQCRRRGRAAGGHRDAPGRPSSRAQQPRRVADQGRHPGVAVDRRRVPQEAGVVQDRPPGAAAPRLPVPAAPARDERRAVGHDAEAAARRPVRHLRVGRAVGAAHRRRRGGRGGQEPEEGRRDAAGARRAAGGGAEEGGEVRDDPAGGEGPQEALPRRHHRGRAVPRRRLQGSRAVVLARRHRQHLRPRRRVLLQPLGRPAGGPDEASPASILIGRRSLTLFLLSMRSFAEIYL